jgi:hypothetical protein
MATLGTFTAGQVLTAAELNAIGTYTTYTPTYSGLTIVNGTVVARWMECNRMVSFYFRWTVGSSDSVAGPYEIGLPAAPAYYGHIFNAYIRVPASQTIVVAAENFADTTANTVRLRAANSGVVGNATVASGNIVTIEGTYEKA